MCDRFGFKPCVHWAIYMAVSEIDGMTRRSRNSSGRRRVGEAHRKAACIYRVLGN